ncbi:hypothetical protein YTPLAS18_06610 [Nitrospira sp.]|nr:hypothetical protein YTPLAS18_06610 [Nitrospira sp.]
MYHGLLAGLTALLLSSIPAGAVPIEHDTRDFEGIPWGATFKESETFHKVEDTGRLKAYELIGITPALGTVPVDSMRFYTAKDRFARVAVRYRSKTVHDAIMKYLENRYGELDRTPGQIAMGSVRFHNWHGEETDVTLRYKIHDEEGVIFFESQVWAPQLNEGAPAGF